MTRPEKSEYAEFYAGYVSHVTEAAIFPAIKEQISEVEKFFAEITEEKGAFAYAEGKWTIKELLGHLIDGEKILAYRALRIARSDKTPIEGYDENTYIENGNFNDLPIAALIEEFVLVRKANVRFFESLPEKAWTRIGTANGKEFSVRALAFIIVGHVRHHLQVIRERYLAQ